jgi:hypothetical protein
VYHNFFPKDRREDVVAAGKRFEDALGHQSAKGVKQDFLAHQGDAPPDDNSARAEEGDHLADGLG